MKFRLYLLSLQALYFPLMPLPVQGDEAGSVEVLASWAQYVSDGLEARVVTTSDACPALELDGKSTAMKRRASPTELHPNSVCSAPVPPGTRHVRLLGKALPTPVTGSPSRVILMGDTGCRVSAKLGLYQACSNSSIWSFRQVAETECRLLAGIVACGD